MILSFQAPVGVQAHRPEALWYAWAMSDTERQRDKARIDRLLDAWDAVIQDESRDGEVPSVETLTLASRSLPPLLERRSKLLGLDAEPGQGGSAAQEEKPVDRIKRLAVVPKAEGG